MGDLASRMSCEDLVDLGGAGISVAIGVQAPEMAWNAMRLVGGLHREANQQAATCCPMVCIRSVHYILCDRSEPHAVTRNMADPDQQPSSRLVSSLFSSSEAQIYQITELSRIIRMMILGWQLWTMMWDLCHGEQISQQPRLMLPPMPGPTPVKACVVEIPVSAEPLPSSSSAHAGEQDP